MSELLRIADSLKAIRTVKEWRANIAENAVNKLNDLFDYQHESVEDFWNHILKKNPYFKLAVIVPKKILKKIIITRY